MNVVVLHGTLSSDPVTRTLTSGSMLVSLELTTLVEGVSISVPVAWFDPPAEVTCAAGDTLLVTGTVRRRFFRTGGLTQTRTEVVASEVIAGGRRRQERAALSRAALLLEREPA